MILTICATSRKWSARYALPPPCSSAPFPLLLLAQTQNGSQGCFCANRGISKDARSNEVHQIVNATGGTLTSVTKPNGQTANYTYK